jgi:hypothetical protein
MTRSTLTIPGLSAATSQIIVHYAAVFLVAFGVQLGAGATGVTSESTLLALLVSAAGAGAVAIGHLLFGLIPSTPTAMAALGISPKVRSAAYQVILSVIITFVTIFGAQLVGGAAHVESLPGVVSLVIAAISAAVTGVVTFLVGLLPAPPVTA